MLWVDTVSGLCSQELVLILIWYKCMKRIGVGGLTMGVCTLYASMHDL